MVNHGDGDPGHPLVEASNSRRWPVVLGTFVVVAVFVVTWTAALRRPFFDDDWGYLRVVEYPGWWHSSIWDPGTGIYRPMLYVWFALLSAVGGIHPLVFHLATMAVVFLVGVLTWRVARAVGLARGAVLAGVVTLLAAGNAYPIAWTAAASSPLAVACALGAMLLLAGGRPGLLRMCGAGLLLLAGLLTREVVIVAPAVFVVLARVRPTGTFRDAWRRSVPLWVVSVGYLVLRAGSGVGNPPGPYHQQVSAHAFTNFTVLVMRAVDFSHYYAPLPVELVVAVTAGLLAVFGWAIIRRHEVVVAGLVWFVLGTLPVVFLVNHAPDPYYVDFALPGLALAVGATGEILTRRLSTGMATAAGAVVLVVLAVAGFGASQSELATEFGPDITETAKLVAQVDARYPYPLTGGTTVFVYSDQAARDRELVTARGSLFAVVRHDRFLGTEVLPLSTYHQAPRVGVVKPKRGAELRGAVRMVVATTGEVPAAHVRFVVTDPGDRQISVAAVSTSFGWLGAWSTTTAPNAPYRISCVAVSPTGVSATCATVPVTVNNP